MPFRNPPHGICSPTDGIGSPPYCCADCPKSCLSCVTRIYRSCHCPIPFTQAVHLHLASTVQGDVGREPKAQADSHLTALTLAEPHYVCFLYILWKSYNFFDVPLNLNHNYMISRQIGTQSWSHTLKATWQLRFPWLSWTHSPSWSRSSPQSNLSNTRVGFPHPPTRWWQPQTIPRPCWPPSSGWCCMHSTQTRCTNLNIRSQTNISSLVIKITFELFFPVDQFPATSVCCSTFSCVKVGIVYSSEWSNTNS